MKLMRYEQPVQPRMYPLRCRQQSRSSRSGTWIMSKPSVCSIWSGSVAEENDEGRELSIALQYYDTTEWEKHYQEAIKDLEGKYPASENEIMLSEDALSQLGITEPKLNMEIPLSYYDKNGQQERTFTLSGWFHSYTGTGMGFVSEAYCKNAGYTMAGDGILSLSLKKMPDDFHRIQRDVELNENQSFSGSVSMKTSNGSVIAMVILLVFFIIGSGYLLIYNVLYISISKDTRFYGLMKTLGTTQAQIKSLVKNQAVKFACIGIPDWHFVSYCRFFWHCSPCLE